VAESFELSSVPATFAGPEKFPRKATCDHAVFARTAWFNPTAKVLSFFSKRHWFDNRVSTATAHHFIETILAERYGMKISTQKAWPQLLRRYKFTFLQGIPMHLLF